MVIDEEAAGSGRGFCTIIQNTTGAGEASTMSGNQRIKAASHDLYTNGLDWVHPAQRAKISTTGADRMEDATWPYVRGDLASTRRSAAMFLENLQNFHTAMGRENWAARWIKLGDDHRLAGELNMKKGAFEEATQAWLCALTSFEVARRLFDEDDPQYGELSTRIEEGIHAFGSSLARKLQLVKMSCSDQTEFIAYYLPGTGPDSRAPAVICISKEDDTGATLLGRLLPVAIDRNVSVLVVSHADISNHMPAESEIAIVLLFGLPLSSARG
ncbi:hypothetical protein ACVWXM_009581 [Bradyrhizobium sp. GM7.3]